MKEFNLIIALAMAAGLIMSSCSKNQPWISGKGDIVTEYLSVEEFSKIHTEGISNMHITYGEVQEVKVLGHANIIDRIKSSVNGDTWSVGLENGPYGDFELTYYVTVPLIEKIKNDGTGKVVIDEFIDQEYLDIVIKGTGGFYGFSMKLDDCKIDIDGLGECEVWTGKTLDVNISGAGKVYYKGDPSVSQRISGLGSIIQVD